MTKTKKPPLTNKTASVNNSKAQSRAQSVDNNNNLMNQTEYSN